VAALLAAGAWGTETRLPRRIAVAAALVLTALTVRARWGSGSLDAMAGAQAVLGPAVSVGPPAAAAVWCAAAAVVLAGPRQLLAHAAFGVFAGFLVAGPSPAGDAGDAATRVVASATAVLVAWALGRRIPRPVALGLAVAAAAAGGASLLVAPGTWRGVGEVDASSYDEGAAIAAAVAALVWAAVLLARRAGLGASRGRVAAPRLG
jgi:uncharacterized protein (TIGR03382 family)